MIDNFLRAPRTVWDYLADALRVIGVLSVIAAGIWFEPTDAGILAFALPGLMIARFLGLRAGVDIAVSVTVLVAAWSNVIDLYTTVVGWDLIVHFVCTAVLTALLYVFLVRQQILPDPAAKETAMVGAIVIATAFGLALSAIWEMVEWAGFTFISSTIFVTYVDTIADMAVGGLGAACVGALMARVRLER